MKLLLLSLSLLIGLSANAKEYTVKGDEARKLMEILASAGYQVSGIDQEWSGKTLKLETKDVLCHYTVAMYPDEWMSSVDCYNGPEQSGPKLANPLAVAQALAKYASQEAGLGNRWMSVKSVACSLVYDSRAYSCVVSADENPQ